MLARTLCPSWTRVSTATDGGIKPALPRAWWMETLLGSAVLGRDVPDTRRT